MRYTIKHEVPGRIRFDLGGKIPETDAVALEEIFLALSCVEKCTAYPKAGSLAVVFEGRPGSSLAQARAKVVSTLDDLTLDQVKSWEAADSLALAPRPRHLFSQIATMTLMRVGRQLFLPQPLRTVLAFFRAIPFWKAAVQSLSRGRLDVPVLDAAAISMGFVQGKANSSGSTMYLLRLAEILEDYTQRRSESSLVRSLLDIPTKARRISGDLEEEVEVSELATGDLIVARLGDQIPVDGVVAAGEADINQSSLTGEPLAVIRGTDDSVYAGTVVEDGEVVIRITGDPQDSKMRAIVNLVEQSDAAKSSEQKHIESLADSLVPWNFLLAGIVAIVTRDLAKTSAALMVDYSCALRLSGAIAVMAAQRESAQRGFMVKGSRYFDHMAEADTIIFDKTGTLTAATPSVREVVAYDGYERDEVLRLAACLEEHFPHPVARAVVKAAFDEGLEHRERHTEVEYVVAHGITSHLDGARVVIGSEHFVIEDEQVPIAADELAAIHERSHGTSPLFLAVDGTLRGVLYIEDPLKENVADVVEQLRGEGFERVIMLTGDNQDTAARIASAAGIDDFRANLLPEDKLALVRKLQDEGRKVVMVGDGVNDSPALAEAYVSIAMGAGSAVAREAADIALVSDDLEALIELRRLSRVLSKRMKHGYGFAVALNTILLALGITGIVTPQTSSILHNGATIALSASNARPFLPPRDEEAERQQALPAPADALPAPTLASNYESAESEDETDEPW